MPQASYGQVLKEIEYHERDFEVTAEEVKVRDYYQKEVARYEKKIAALPQSYFDGKKQVEKALQDARVNQLPLKELKALERRLAEYPNSPSNAYEVWQNEKRQA